MSVWTPLDIFVLALATSCTRPVAAQSTGSNRTLISVLNICSNSGNDGAKSFHHALAAFLPVINGMTDRFPTFQLEIHYECTNEDDVGSAGKAFIDGYLKGSNKAAILGTASSSQSLMLADIARLYYVPVIGADFEAQAARSNITIISKALLGDTLNSGMELVKKMDARIIVAFRNADTENTPMECLIYQLRLFGPKYQWIFGGALDHLDVDAANDCTMKMKSLAMQNAVIFDMAISDDDYEAPPSSTGLKPEDLYAIYRATNPEINYNATLMRTFDTLTTLALAINDTIQEFPYEPELQLQNSSFKAALLRNIRAQKFNGVEGPVDFDENGDRVTSVEVTQLIEGTRVTVALFSPTHNITDRDFSLLQFSGNGRPPVDTAPVIELSLKVDRRAVVVCIALSAAGAAFGLASVGATVRYRQLRLIKMSSPRLNLIIALGCVLGYASCVVAALVGGDGGFSTPALCWAQVACLAFGFTCALGAMFAKTWRVHVIFAAPRTGSRVISDWHLFTIVGALLLLDIIIFILLGTLDPITVHRIEFAPEVDTDAGVIYNFHLRTCQANHLPVWNGMFLGKNGIILLFGIFFAWETRKVHIESLNDSKQIGIGVYNIMLMGAIGTTLSYVLPASQVTLHFLMVSACILACATTTLVLVYGNKIRMLLQRSRFKVGDLSAGGSTAGTSRDAAPREIIG